MKVKLNDFQSVVFPNNGDVFVVRGQKKIVLEGSKKDKKCTSSFNKSIF